MNNGDDSFVEDELVEGSTVAVMGQNPGAFEVKGQRVIGGRFPNYITEPHYPAPYIGPTGLVMEREFFPIAGLQRGEVSVMNAIRCRWQGGNDLPRMSTKVAKEALEHCHTAHTRIPASTRLIVAEGGWALYALTGEGVEKERTIDSWRGYLLPYNPITRPTLHHSSIYYPKPNEISVLATYHLSYLFKNPWERPSSQRDWSKVPLILSGKWPERIPPLIVQPPDVWPLVSAFDTEFPYDKKTDTRGSLTRYSMASEGHAGPSVYVVEAADAGPITVQPGSTVILQNAMADLGDMNTMFGGVEVQVEDDMLAHSVLWPDLAHDLNFLGSMYARTNRWKHLQWSNPRLYAGGDALGTLDVWNRGLSGEFARDPASLRVYRKYVLPLVSIILKAGRHGINVNQRRVDEVIGEFGAEMREAQAQACAALGWPINIGSVDQVTAQLYERESIHLNKISGRAIR